MAEQRRAVALISGGLDSMLAAKVIINQGVKVEGINFFTGFCIEGHTRSIRNNKPSNEKKHNALWVAEQLGIKLRIIDVVEEYKEIVLNPKHGYGANLNPCLDCKIFMVNKTLATDILNNGNFDFIITGEVVGQRPKSQRKETMPLIAREFEANDRLLRPLSAQLLPPTLPEREGWVSRSKLYSFHGRDRKPQIKLAKSMGFSEWAQPAGGCCFLTDKQYSNKLQDLWNSKKTRDYDFDDIMLLKVGRHIRPNNSFKIIIARDDGENRYLTGYQNRFISLRASSHNGPLSLIDGTPTDNEVLLAAKIVARYGQGRSANKVKISIRQPDGLTRLLDVKPLSPEHLRQEWHVGN